MPARFIFTGYAMTPIAVKLTIKSHLRPITDAISDDPATAKVVRSWQEQGFAGFRKQGFEPEQIVATVNMPLDGREASVREHATDLTRLLAEGMLQTVEDADLASLQQRLHPHRRCDSGGSGQSI